MESKLTNPFNLPATVTPKSELAERAAELTNTIREVTRARPGQPTKRTPELIETIIDRISAGESLLQICQDDAMPGYSTFRRWEREDPTLRDQTDAAYEDMVRMLDDANDDILRGGILSTGDIARDLAAVKQNNWRASKHNRRKFGEHTRVEHSHKVEPFMLPIEAVVIDDDEDGL